MTPHCQSFHQVKTVVGQPLPEVKGHTHGVASLALSPLVLLLQTFYEISSLLLSPLDTGLIPNQGAYLQLLLTSRVAPLRLDFLNL